MQSIDIDALGGARGGELELQGIAIVGELRHDGREVGRGDGCRPHKG